VLLWVALLGFLRVWDGAPFVGGECLLGPPSAEPSRKTGLPKSLDPLAPREADGYRGWECRLLGGFAPAGSGGLPGYPSALLRCEPLRPSLATCGAPVLEELGVALSDLPQLIP